MAVVDGSWWRGVRLAIQDGARMAGPELASRGGPIHGAVWGWLGVAAIVSKLWVTCVHIRLLGEESSFITPESPVDCVVHEHRLVRLGCKRTVGGGRLFVAVHGSATSARVMSKHAESGRNVQVIRRFVEFRLVRFVWCVYNKVFSISILSTDV